MNDSSKILTAALAGAAVGAATALLLTPTTGKELRGKLAEKIDAARGDIENWVDQGKQIVGSVTKKVKDEGIEAVGEHLGVNRKQTTGNLREHSGGNSGNL